ncbi:hypothetical protein [Lihuaxuella thermophila]|uniref:Uncharacterized protein n=1 Tax=Lihuaxuella thermophila TaxID=1173111 RepID=A0A1H8CVN8_9BACL|nr:hypothetical protein [Lihuaxuella thermophila]SEM99281.1 hypothetical protein SAMN05444955_104152 [Lihuaxuella thermophila]
MSDPSEEKKPVWPRYLPYTPIAMGMIQPEWMYMSHFFEDEEEEMEEATSPQVITASGKSPPGPAKPDIRINFRARF